MTYVESCRRQLQYLPVLPKYIDDLIFDPNGLGGKYQRGREEVEICRDADEERVKRYLGTYFPRSFSESYTIFMQLFVIPSIAASIPANESLSVLNIGSGTGGDTLGLLEAIIDSGYRPARIDIYSIDCSQFALDCQQRIIDALAHKYGMNIELHRHVIVFPISAIGFKRKLEEFLAKHAGIFDLVLCWKLFNEFYRTDFSMSQGIYRAFLEAITPVLGLKGICALLDVVDYPKNHSEKIYFPKIMNKEVKEYLRNSNAELSHILPLSCAFWAHECIACYTRREFLVHFSREAAGSHSATYKIMAHRDFAASLTTLHRQSHRFHCNSLHPSEYCEKGRIKNGPADSIISDGFKLA